MRNGKNLLKLLGLVFFGAGLTFSQVNKANAEAYFFGNVGLGFEAGSTSAITIPSVPEYIRNVPPHDGDDITPPFAPIKDSELNMYKIGLTADGRIGFGISEENWDFKIGGGFRMVPNSSKVERDYLGNPGSDQRGYGTALTYYELTSDVPLNLSAKLSYNFSNPRSKDMTASLFLDYAAEFINNLRIETGWDRNDKLETKDKYPLGNLIVHEIKGGIHIPLFNPENLMGNSGPFLEFYAGGNFPQMINKTQLASDIGLDAKPNFTVGVKFGGEFDTLSHY